MQCAEEVARDPAGLDELAVGLRVDDGGGPGEVLLKVDAVHGRVHLLVEAEEDGGDEECLIGTYSTLLEIVLETGD